MLHSIYKALQVDNHKTRELGFINVPRLLDTKDDAGGSKCLFCC